MTDHVWFSAMYKDTFIHLASRWFLLVNSCSMSFVTSIPAEELVRTVMTLFQDQPDLLLGFKEFIPETQDVLNHLVPVCGNWQPEPPELFDAAFWRFCEPDNWALL